MDAYDIAAVHDSLSERFTYGHRIPDDNDDIVSHVVSGKISVGVHTILVTLVIASFGS